MWRSVRADWHSNECAAASRTHSIIRLREDARDKRLAPSGASNYGAAAAAAASGRHLCCGATIDWTRLRSLSGPRMQPSRVARTGRRAQALSARARNLTRAHLLVQLEPPARQVRQTQGPRKTHLTFIARPIHGKKNGFCRRADALVQDGSIRWTKLNFAPPFALPSPLSPALAWLQIVVAICSWRATLLRRATRAETRANGFTCISG